MDPGIDDRLTLNRLSTVVRLVAGAVHEVNNALQLISGTAEMMAEVPEVPEPVRGGLELIREQSARAAAAMVGVAALSRPPSERTSLLDLGAVVTQAAELRRYAIGRNGFSIAVNVDATPLPVTGNESQLLQAVLNQIEGAERSLRGRSNGRIRVTAGRHGETAYVTVESEGPTVPAAAGDRASESPGSSQPPEDSWALDQDVARAIASAHGGAVLSEVRGSGVAIVLRLPVA